MTRVITVAFALALSAQWIKYPTPGIPRTADGKPNLTAPAPKLPDGKPDLSGLWLTQGIYIGDIAKDINAVIHFNITGDGGGTWTLDCTKSEGWMTAGASGTPKMTITVSKLYTLNYVST